MKRCTKCLIEKPVAEFHKHCRHKDGLYTTCKPCTLKANSKYAAKKKIANAAWYERRKEQQKLAMRRNRAVRVYGFTLEEKAEMYANQGNGCAICGRDEDICVDHDAVGVRGLLCRTCNSALGQLQDTPELLRHAALYLETHSRLIG